MPAMLVATIGRIFRLVTTEGRLLSALRSLYGLAVFWSIAASFAGSFAGRDAEAPEGEIAGASEFALPHAASGAG